MTQTLLKTRDSRGSQERPRMLTKAHWDKVKLDIVIVTKVLVSDS
jgi:hypothetical protein